MNGYDRLQEDMENVQYSSARAALEAQLMPKCVSVFKVGDQVRSQILGHSFVVTKEEATGLMAADHLINTQKWDIYLKNTDTTWHGDRYTGLMESDCSSLTNLTRQNNREVTPDDVARGLVTKEQVERDRIFQEKMSRQPEEVAPGFFVGDRVRINMQTSISHGKPGVVVSEEEFSDVWGSQEIFSHHVCVMVEESHSCSSAKNGESNIFQFETKELIHLTRQKSTDDTGTIDKAIASHREPGEESKWNDDLGMSPSLTMAPQSPCLVCGVWMFEGDIKRHRAKGECYADHEPVDLSDQYDRQDYLMKLENEYTPVDEFRDHWTG